MGAPGRLLHCGLIPNSPRLRVCAVSYLNTAPLVWGMLHGPQRGLFDLEFASSTYSASPVLPLEGPYGGGTLYAYLPAGEAASNNYYVVSFRVNKHWMCSKL